MPFRIFRLCISKFWQHIFVKIFFKDCFELAYYLPVQDCFRYCHAPASGLVNKGGITTEISFSAGIIYSHWAAAVKASYLSCQYVWLPCFSAFWLLFPELLRFIPYFTADYCFMRILNNIPLRRRFLPLLAWFIGNLFLPALNRISYVNLIWKNYILMNIVLHLMM